MKDICGTLASLQSDSPKVGIVGAEARQYEEPTRDPDVWPPPTPVEHRLAIRVSQLQLTFFSLIFSLSLTVQIYTVSQKSSRPIALIFDANITERIICCRKVVYFPTSPV